MKIDFLKNSTDELNITLYLYVHRSSTNNLTRAEFQPRTFSSGCNDAFSVFGFLAFLLALLDLILELNMAKKRRRKRFSPISLFNNGSDFLKDWEEENDVFNYNAFFETQWKPEKLAKEDQASSFAVSYNVVHSS